MNHSVTGLYSRWLDELWNGDLSRLDYIATDIVAPEFVGSWPHRPGFVHGPNELAAVIREGRQMFDELVFSCEVGPVGEIADGGVIAARWVGRGVLDGAPVRFHGHDLLRHIDGKFVAYWVLSEDPTPDGTTQG